MEKIKVKGPSKLNGLVKISAAKNAALPMMVASLLTSEEVHLTNLPKLNDVHTLNKLLMSLGVQCEDNKFKANNVTNFEASYDLVKTMRASFLVLGPLVARFKKARVSLPGGCAIGARPIDFHLKALEKMGAKIDLQDGYVEVTCDELIGTEIVFPFPSVGATENILMAATLAKGVTTIQNAAREPEISALCIMLEKMGAKITGAGSSKITITGCKRLSGGTFEVIPDRIEAITFIIAALMTKSSLEIENIVPEHLESVVSILRPIGAKIEMSDNSLFVTESHLEGELLVETAPYPGIPTDAQAQLMSLACVNNGRSIITESIYENRFMHVPELNRLGAEILLKGKNAFINGPKKLKSAPVMCTDLRASAALVLSALVAEGETEIQRIYHLDRGYELIDQKLEKLGVKIRREK